MINRSGIDLLDRDSVLDAATSARRSADRAEVDLLLVAAHFADLHPVPPGGVRAGFGDQQLRVADPVGADLGRERFARLAGVGTPDVAEFAPVELAAALGITSDAARRLVGDALELRHRLPRLWALVQDGRLQAWKARSVAGETTPLSPQAAAFVDRHVAVVAARNRVPGPGQLQRLMHEALLRCDPEVAAGREQSALDRRGVWSSHRESTATTTITIVADTPDALAFDDTVGRVATVLGDLGDADDLDVRRARAVGILADPQRSLDLISGDRSEPGRSRVGATLHLHLDGHAIACLTGAEGPDGGGVPVATEERYGALSLDLVRAWLERSEGITVRPVLDLGRVTSAPARSYVPPASMAERVRLRDRTCVFPDCTRSARSADLDHIVAFNPGSAEEVTGHTHEDNLAPLCRPHHRVKTHGRWRYRRDPDGSYTWTSPTLRSYVVDPSLHGGTRHPPPGDRLDEHAPAADPAA